MSRLRVIEQTRRATAALAAGPLVAARPPAAPAARAEHAGVVDG